MCTHNTNWQSSSKTKDRNTVSVDFITKTVNPHDKRLQMANFYINTFDRPTDTDDGVQVKFYGDKRQNNVTSMCCKTFHIIHAEWKELSIQTIDIGDVVVDAGDPLRISKLQNIQWSMPFYLYQCLLALKSNFERMQQTICASRSDLPLS